MSTRFCKVEREGRVLIITMNRPEKRNSITASDSFEMEAIFDDFVADPQLWVAILTGAGDIAFSAGANFLGDSEASHPPTGFGGLTARHGCNKPLIAAVNGYALGGGLELALACDIIVASENAELGLVEPRIGALALAGGPLRLPRQIPYHIAMGMLLTACRIGAVEAHRWGLLNEVVSKGQALNGAKRWAEEILTCAPLPVRTHKELAQQSIEGVDFIDLIRRRHEELAEGEFATEDLKEGISAFAEKRKPVWKGR